MTAEETWELNSEQLWAELGRELLASEIGDRKKTKYLAILSSTRYVNSKHIVPFSHAHALSLTRGQVTCSLSPDSTDLATYKYKYKRYLLGNPRRWWSRPCRSCLPLDLAHVHS